MNLGIAVGASLVLLPNPRDIPAVVKSITKHRVTMAPAVPAMYNAINQYPGIEKLDLRSVKVCNSGSAPLPVEVLQRFEELTGGKITEGFGLTETSPVTHSNPLLGTRKVGSIGVPLPGTDAKIVDIENGTREMPPGTQGELILRGPQVMPGYWNNREETEKTIRDGWLFTGDLSVMDEDGFFFIVGRKKDMILCSGYNVFPDEVDRVLMAHPGILEAATIGLPDEKRGETVKSFVVLAPGEHLTGEEIITYCRENLAAYKVPRAIEFRGDLPKSSVLKILRRELKEQELAKAGTKEKSAGARMRSEA
jgi:long-chain acyl-CoA synthetase